MGERPLPPEGTARAEAFCAYRDSMELLNDDAVWLSLQVLVVHTSLQCTRHVFAVSLQWFVVRVNFGLWFLSGLILFTNGAGVRFDCRECAFFLCVHRCELIGFAGRLQCTRSHFPSPEVRFLLRGFPRFLCASRLCTAVLHIFAAESAASY